MRVLVFVKMIGGEVNPYDLSALECALRIEGAQITVMSMAPAAAAAGLRALTGYGVDCILLCDPRLAGSDTLATAYALSRAADLIRPDLIVAGVKSVDGETAQVGPMVAAMTGSALVPHVMQIADGILTDRDGRLLPLRAGMLLTVEKSLPPRFLSMFALRREVEVWDAARIGADPGRIGQAGSPTLVQKTYENTVGRRTCKFIGIADFTGVLRASLDSRAHQTAPPPLSLKFENVTAIGEAAAERARQLAKHVTLLPEAEAEELARQLEKARPEIVLWNADVYGRNTAPQVAALLGTGLCADCTGLVNADGRLKMIRPAGGGRLMAEIVCRTLPQMATVRIPRREEALLVSLGAGAVPCLAQVKAFALKHNAGLAASRAAVDAGAMPYDAQVGLTGKAVSPKVYLAVGISGAVHHTCACETAGTVIAVNPDRGARIFDYADYGIVASAEDFLKELSL